ncbi:MAG TPA: Crp/Fnr family transcriptional regulator [Chloroflexia bacterium]|nr:Crp/Fnr family transcriptional regulator [Chloroflexia bacterium]
MPAVTEPDQLGKILLFSGLSSAELIRINDLLHCRTVPAGTNIISVAQPGEVAYIILSGTVKIHVETPDGNEVILVILGAGEIVGEMSVVDSLSRSANVITMEESTVCWIDRATFWGLFETMPGITHNLVRILSRRIRMANAQIQALATLDVYGRVARQLLAFAQEYGEPQPGGGVLIPIRLTQSDIAGMIGATRVRVNQVLVAYRQRKYLSIDSNYRITIHNAEALSQRAV